MMSIKSRIPYCYGDIPGLQHTISPMTVEQYLHVEEKYFSFMENKPNPARILLQNEVTGLLPRLRSSLGNWKLWNSGDMPSVADSKINNKDTTDNTHNKDNLNEAGDGIIKDIFKINNQTPSSSTPSSSTTLTTSSTLTAATPSPIVDDYPAYLNPFDDYPAYSNPFDDYPAYSNPFDDQFTSESSTEEQKPQPYFSRILKYLKKVLSRPFKMCLNRN